MRELNRNLACATALFDELARSGVGHVVVSPGSRSAPLALVAAAHPDVRDHALLDERSAGFFALGLARSVREPVALVCTSGTAAANYLPAVVEAHYSRVPLIVLTADRPAELRDCGAGQTIDQVRLYGPFARFLGEVAAESAPLDWVRALACRAVADAAQPGGAVHVNVAFREPLDLTPVPAEQAALRALDPRVREGRGDAPHVRVVGAGAARPETGAVTALAERLASEPRGWLVAGPLDAPSGLAPLLGRLARALDWPVLAEPLSGLRSGAHDRSRLVDAHDAVLRVAELTRRHAPRLALRFGAPPTSKAYRLLLETQPEIEQVVVDPAGWSDPTARAAEIVRADPRALAEALLDSLAARESAGASDFVSHWTAAGRAARRALDGILDAESTLSEPLAVRTLAAKLPAGTTLFCASSLAVRHVDLVWPPGPTPIRFVANRGANGIDGTLSCALGHATGSAGPTVLLIGDLALLHDASALASAARSEVDLTVVVLDNNGGGIFELLPVASSSPRETFERHFGTPHDLDLCAVIAGYGLRRARAASARDLESALAEGLGRAGCDFIVVRTERRENAALLGRMHEAVARAVRRDLA